MQDEVIRSKANLVSRTRVAPERADARVERMPIAVRQTRRFADCRSVPILKTGKTATGTEPDGVSGNDASAAEAEVPAAAPVGPHEVSV